MKRLMIVASLVLAIGASMTAGTMAKYTQTLEEQTAAITAKSFYINSSNNGESLNEDFKIAPGEEKVFEYTIKNTEKGGDVASETDIKVIAEIVKELDDDGNGNSKRKLFDDLKVTIESDLDFTTEDSNHINVQKENKAKPDESTRVVAKGETIFKADVVQSKTIKIKVSWPKNSKPNYSNYKDNKVKLSLKLDAVQQ